MTDTPPLSVVAPKQASLAEILTAAKALVDQSDELRQERDERLTRVNILPFAPRREPEPPRGMTERTFTNGEVSYLIKVASDSLRQALDQQREETIAFLKEWTENLLAEVLTETRDWVEALLAQLRAEDAAAGGVHRTVLPGAAAKDDEPA